MTPNFFQGAPPEKNLGRFYRVPFKSILRIQIKRASIASAKAPLHCLPNLHPILLLTKYNILHCAMKGMLVFAMCHYNYISSWEVSFCCGCRQQGPPARVVFFYSGKKMLFSNAKMFFPLAMWNRLPFGCTQTMLVSYVWQKLKDKHC